MSSNGQVLITGVYRSGTEYFSSIISGHPQLSCTMYHVNGLRFMYGKYDPIENRENYTLAVTDTARRLKQRYDLVLDTDQVNEQCSRLGKVSYGVLYDLIMTVLWLGDSRRFWAEKCQLVWREIPEFFSSLPGSKAFMVLRDPRSVLASFKHFTYAPAPAYLGAVFNCYDAMVRASEYQTQFPDRFRVFLYEEFVRKPVQARKAAWEFLGLETKDMLDVAPDLRDSSGRLWASNSTFDMESRNEFDIGQSIERWKQYLSPEEIMLAEYVNQNTMENCGYERSSRPVDWEAMLRLFLYDEKITDYFRGFLLDESGIQEFPTDPVNPDSWAENAVQQAKG